MRRSLMITLILLMAAAAYCLAVEPFGPLVSRVSAFCGLVLGLALIPFIFPVRKRRRSGILADVDEPWGIIVLSAERGPGSTADESAVRL